MDRPIIGVMPLYDETRESLWMLPGYMEAVEYAGGVPVMLPLTEDRENIYRLCDACDGFLFTGGHDVNPAVYGAQKSPACGEACDARDRMEQILFTRVLELDKPILGICRGIQIINAFLGGTLYQDIPTEHPTSVEHHQTPPYDRPVHKVAICPDTPLRELLGVDELEVNSYHHQAIQEKAETLVPMAISEDGLIEAVYHPGKRFLWAVQWHPEFSWKVDENSRRIVKAFVDASKQ